VDNRDCGDNAVGARHETGLKTLHRCGITRICLLLSEAEIADAHKERIARIYQGPEWRALARGETGWHAIAGAPSEAAAIEVALASCTQAGERCRLYAIGNFRIAGE